MPERIRRILNNKFVYMLAIHFLQLKKKSGHIFNSKYYTYTHF